MHKPSIRTKNWESESPSTEVHFARTYVDLDKEWNSGRKNINKHCTVPHEATQPQIKLYTGITYEILKTTLHPEQYTFEDMKQHVITKLVVATTQPANVYVVESFEAAILSLNREI